MASHFERHGGNCFRWLDKWMASWSIEAGARTAIELCVHMRTLHYVATYDQVNLGASAAMENMFLQVAQIVEAYRADAKRPNWAAFKHIGGFDDAMGPVLSSMRTHRQAHQGGGRGGEPLAAAPCFSTGRRG